MDFLAVAGVEEGVVEGAEAAVAVEGFPAGAHCAHVLAVGFARLKYSCGYCVVRFSLADEGVGVCRVFVEIVLFDEFAVGRAWDVAGNARVAVQFVLVPLLELLAFLFFVGVEMLALLFFDGVFVGFDVDVVGFAVRAAFFDGGFPVVRAAVDGDAVGFFVGALFFGVGAPGVYVDFGVVGVVVDPAVDLVVGDLAVAIV